MVDVHKYITMYISPKSGKTTPQNLHPDFLLHFWKQQDSFSLLASTQETCKHCIKVLSHEDKKRKKTLPKPISDYLQAYTFDYMFIMQPILKIQLDCVFHYNGPTLENMNIKNQGHLPIHACHIRTRRLQISYIVIIIFVQVCHYENLWPTSGHLAACSNTDRSCWLTLCSRQQQEPSKFQNCRDSKVLKQSSPSKTLSEDLSLMNRTPHWLSSAPDGGCRELRKSAPNPIQILVQNSVSGISLRLQEEKRTFNDDIV